MGPDCRYPYIQGILALDLLLEMTKSLGRTGSEVSIDIFSHRVII